MPDRRVQLHFGRYIHPVYREQLHAVPDGWSYEAGQTALSQADAPTKLVLEQAARLAGARDVAERVALRVLSKAGYVHRVRAPVVTDAALIHAAELLLRNSPSPYVVDFEHAALFLLYQPAALDRPWARRVLERALLDEQLRFLLGWSDAACRSIASVVSPAVAARLAPKLRTVAPAIRLAVERPPRRPSGPLRLAFVGTKFLEKGGVEAVEALRLVRKEHDVTLELVSFVPDAWRARLAAEPGLTIHAPGGADVVQRLFRESDALLFPSHMDTFGYVVLEAMSHGLPVLAPRHLALAETVVDGTSGLLFGAENMLYDEQARLRFRHVLPPPASYLEALQVPSPGYVEGIAAAIGRMASDRELHGRLSEGAFEAVRSGPSSMGRRRAQLAEIYAAAAR